MEERSAPCPSEAEENGRTPQDSTPVLTMDTIEAFVRSTDKVTVAAAIAAVPHSPPNPLQLQESCDPRAPLTLWRLQDEEQKMRFLQSICTVCDTAVEEKKEQDLRIFCRRNKLVENIMELLSEEPRGKLCSELRQQAMAAITALSAVEAVLEDKIPLLTVCFQSIVPLPSEQNLDISLYSRVGWKSPQEEEQEKLKEWEDDDEISLFTSTTDIVLRFATHFHSSENTDLILVALQGMRDCSNYNTLVAANMMAALIDNFKPTANDVQQIVTAIHRWRKLITEKRPKRIIRRALHWLADSDPRAVTLSLLRCSPTCDKDMWEVWKIVLSSEDVVPQIVQQLLQLLEMAPLSQETKIGSLPLAATIALHEIVQHEQYGPQLHLYFPELFVALIFQMVSSGVLTPMEVTAVMADPFCPSAPTSALRIVVEVLHNLLQCVGLEHLAHYMERHGLWGQLLGAATWRDGLCTLA
ncbi:UNVERIFIED_CONTAM: hypothetical protein H355_004488, partial [Colinus virginianus]